MHRPQPRQPLPTAHACSIAPPDLLARVAEHGTRQQRAAAVRALTLSAAIRARRSTLAHLARRGLAVPALAAGEQIAVYDVKHGGDTDLPGDKMRSGDDPAVADESVNQAFDGADKTYGFYRDVFNRDSVDGQGLELISSVHYENDFDNAFWNGQQMVYGDGSGHLFQVGSLTSDIAVIAHELTHGVTQYTAGLDYHLQPGALNESMSDVFGSMVKQYTLGQSAADADWLIGAGILGDAVQGQALRSLAAPGTAYDGDNQPATMDGYVTLPDDDDPTHDHGGVHINSGIPNHAFYLAATALGGNSWETVGPIWYDALTTKLQHDSDFKAAADATVTAAGELYGEGSAQQEAVRDAWTTVKVLDNTPARARRRTKKPLKK